MLAQGPPRGDANRGDGNGDRRDRGQGRRDERPREERPREGNREGPRSFGPFPRDSREGSPGGGPRIVVEDRGGEAGRGGAFGAPGGGIGFGFAGDSAKKFKTPPMPDTIPSWFKENDKDADGQVAMFEWSRDMGEFNKYDRNGDGFITVGEAMHFAPKPPPAAVASGTPPPTAPVGTTTPPAAGTPPASASPAAPASPAPGGDERSRGFAQGILRRYDRNSDSKLDQQELQSTMQLRTSWQQYDANRDNMLDLDEITAFMRAQGNDSRISFGGGFGGGGPGGGRGNESPEEGMRRFMSRFDRNNDGKLNREEFPRFFRPEQFDQIDTNRDGQLDLQEYTKGMENMRSSFGGSGGGSGGGFGGRGRGGP